MRRIIPVALFAPLLTFAAHAALHDRGGGLLYDDVQNLTWLQDANYVKTSGYRVDGYLNWNEAKTWAANLAYYDAARGVTLTGWRLPGIAPVGSQIEFEWSNDGSTDAGPNITRPSSELSYMYYVNLQLKGFLDPAGNWRSDFGVFGTGFDANVCGPDAASNVTVGGVTVKNVQNCVYWHSTSFADPGSDPPGLETPWTFYTWAGYQAPSGDMSPDCQGGWALHGCANAWAVREGDVGPVPEPAPFALLLVGLGMLSLGGVRRRMFTG